MLVMNRYEFLAAGLRNGDFDERMVSDTLRSATTTLFDICEMSINARRTSRKRQALYEHLEWLHNRWTDRRPGWGQRLIEWIMGRPFQGRRKVRL